MGSPAEQFMYPFTGTRASTDWYVFSGALVAGAIFLWHVVKQGLLLTFIDQYAHLAIARQVTDSLTPGLSQLGFWPPLLHMLMAPFTYFDALYTSGLAGAIVLVPVMALGAVLTYSLAYLLSGNRIVSFAAAAAFVLNPYVLYFAVTPMMEVLFLVLVIGTAYFLAFWWHHQTLGGLMWLSSFVALACLARFEGFLLVPLVGVCVLVRLISTGAAKKEIEASMHLYGLVAIIGAIFVFAYGYVYGGDPLAFMHSQWSAHEQQKDFVLPAAGSMTNSFIYLLHGSAHVLGGVQIGLALFVSFIVLALARGSRMLIVAVSAVVLSPFVFDLYALYSGSIVLYVPELPPYDVFFNERYGLNWIGFVVLMPALAASLLFKVISSRPVLAPIGLLVASTILFIQFNSTLMELHANACDGCFQSIRENWLASKPWRSDLAYVLANEYDGGRILMTRAFFNEVAVRSGIPLENFILEANEHYYDEALHMPWFFAEWVVMFDPNSPNIPPWERTNERVSEIWAYADEFPYFYERVAVSGSDQLFRLRKDRLETFVLAQGIDPNSVPTLVDADDDWDVERTYQKLAAQFDLAALQAMLVEH